MLSDLKWGVNDKAVGGEDRSARPRQRSPRASVKLVGSPSSGKLAITCGHTIEVTGSIEKADKDPQCGRGIRRPNPRRSSSSAPALNVRNVKMVAATCQAQ